MMRYSLVVLGLCSAIAPCGAAAPEPAIGCQSKVRVGGPGNSPARIGCGAVDHSCFDALLRRFVDCRGMVCYREWKADGAAIARLHEYLCSLGRIDPSAQCSTASRLAIYINAYNALTLWGVLQEYPTPSIQLHNRAGACYRIFEDLELWISGDYLSLNRIENEVLRPMHEPRIHFALVCAAKGCPRLRNEAYVAERLGQQLTDNAIDFFACRRRFHLCRMTGQVRLSPILQWYGKDFGNSDQGVVAAILPYLPCADRDWILRHPCGEVKFLCYDWGLNDRCPSHALRMTGIGFTLYAKVEPGIAALRKAAGKGP